MTSYDPKHGIGDFFIFVLCSLINLCTINSVGWHCIRVMWLLLSVKISVREYNLNSLNTLHILTPGNSQLLGFPGQIAAIHVSLVLGLAVRKRKNVPLGYGNSICQTSHQGGSLVLTSLPCLVTNTAPDHFVNADTVRHCSTWSVSLYLR